MRHSQSNFRLELKFIVTRSSSNADSISRAKTPSADSLVDEDCMTINSSFNCTIAYCTSDVSHIISRRISFFFFSPHYHSYHHYHRESIHASKFARFSFRSCARRGVCVHEINLMPHSCTKREQTLPSQLQEWVTLLLLCTTA